MYYPQKKLAINKGLSISLVCHFLVVTILVMEAKIFTSQPIDFSSAVRVDLVGMPDKVDPKQMPEIEKPAEEVKAEPAAKPAEPIAEKNEEKAMPKKVDPPKDKDAISFSKADQKKQQSALDKIKSMQAIDKIKNEVNNKPAATAPVKGNVISPGSSLTGLNQLQHSNFISQIDKHIKNHWTLPQWLANKNYRAQVLVKFDERGLVIAKRLVKSSGNPAYDEVAMETIDKSSPFPSPPDKFSAIFKYDGILVGFPD